MPIAVAAVLAVVVTGVFISKKMARSAFNTTTRGLMNLHAQLRTLKFEASMNEQLTLVRQMVKTPSIVNYLTNPKNSKNRSAAFEDFASFQNSFLSKVVFWASDADLEFWSGMEYSYTVNPDDPNDYWYNMTLYETEEYNFNINYNEALNATMLWVNAVVRDSSGKSVGMAGTGIPLQDFIDTMYHELPPDTTMYLFNDKDEITGALDPSILKDKLSIYDMLPAVKNMNIKPEQPTPVSAANGEYLFAPIPLVHWHIVQFTPYTTAACIKNAARSLGVTAAIALAVVLIALIRSFLMQNIQKNEHKLGAKLISETQDLSVAAKENAATGQDQSAAVKEIVATMEDNNALAETISQKITDVSGVASKTNGNVHEGVELLTRTITQLSEIALANQTTINGIKSLGEKIENIWDIVTLITNVADQAKIIAFNAELEASSAGESGKNFHIVASEIRRLADGIIDGTKEIKERITEIQQSSDSLILASENGTAKISEGRESAKVLEKKFTSIQNASEVTVQSANDITTIIQQQTAASEQILTTLKQIAFGIQNFTQATERISNASENLRVIAEDLNK